MINSLSSSSFSLSLVVTLLWQEIQLKYYFFHHFPGGSHVYLVFFPLKFTGLLADWLWEAISFMLVRLGGKSNLGMGYFQTYEFLNFRINLPVGYQSMYHPISSTSETILHICNILKSYSMISFVSKSLQDWN